jgi:hypothetical protein
MRQYDEGQTNYPLDFRWWEPVMNVYQAINKQFELQENAKKEEPCII